MNEQMHPMTAVADPEAARSATAGAGAGAAAEYLPGTGHDDPGHHDPGHHDPGHDDAGHDDAGHDDAGHHEGRRHGDTRARIQQVALELFAEQGYEKTSLREIAERLDVTKAALYYHFKSKEDIVSSLVEDYFGQMDALIAWAKTQPRNAQTRDQILNRYVRIVADGSDVFRMLHHNQAAVNTLASAKQRGDVFRERMTALVDVLAEPEAGMPARLRAAMTLGGVSVGWMFFVDQVQDRATLCSEVLAIAKDLAKDPS
jgi:AcrR family transcriptional regulator